MEKDACSGCRNEQENTGKELKQKIFHYAPSLLAKGILTEYLINMRTDYE